MLTIVALIPILAFVTMALLAWAIAGPKDQTTQSRLRAYGYDLSKRAAGDLSQPFSNRVILPFLGGIGRLIAKMTPAGIVETSRQRLRQAQQPMSLGTFLVLRAMVAGLLGLLPLLSLLRGGGVLMLAVALVLIFVGYRLPDIWLSFRIDGRKEQITRGLPDALDLIVVCVEAGLGLEAAIQRVVESTRGPLAEEFAQTLAEIGLGRSRREALADLSTRGGSADLQTFIAAIIQADQMGVSIAEALRVQAEAMRVRRRQRAEELIAKAPIKMLIPLTAFIFPALFAVLLGPAAMKIAAMFGGLR